MKVKRCLVIVTLVLVMLVESAFAASGSFSSDTWSINHPTGSTHHRSVLINVSNYRIVCSSTSVPANTYTPYTFFSFIKGFCGFMLI